MVPQKVASVNKTNQEQVTEGNMFFRSITPENDRQRQLDHILVKGFDDANSPGKIAKYLEKHVERPD